MNALGIVGALAVLALIAGLYLRRKLRTRAQRTNLGPVVRPEGTRDALDNEVGLVSRQPDWRDLDQPVEFLVRSPGKVDPDDTSIPAFLLRTGVECVHLADGTILSYAREPGGEAPVTLPDPLPDFLRRP